MSEPSQSSRSFTTLGGVGVSEGFALSVGRNSKCFLITIANINTSVTVQYEKSNTADFAAITYQGEQKIYTENKNYELIVPPGNGNYVRLKFVAEVGGSTATIAGVFQETVGD